jgi:predicted metal-binding membrane protein
MFMQMWLVMMVAMMMPSLVLMLARYRRVLRERGDNVRQVRAATVLAAIAYFAVWQTVGAVAYPLGTAFAAATMKWSSLSQAVPSLTGAALILCGVVQLSRWKMKKLRHCRDRDACEAKPMSPNAAGAFKHGTELGLCCASCCSGFMLALLVLGAMDLVVMSAIAVAITVERFLAKPDVAVRASGAALLGLGLVAICRLVVL